MQWFTAGFQRLWNEIRGNFLYDLTKYLLSPIGGILVTAGFWQTVPVWGRLAIFVVGTLIFGVLASAFLRPKIFQLKSIRARIQPKGTGLWDDYVSDCEIEVLNLSHKTVDQVRVEITGLHSVIPEAMPSQIELSPRDDVERRILPGDKMVFVLLRTVWLVTVSGSERVAAKAIGNWGGLHPFALGKGVPIKIKIMANDTPAFEKTFQIFFSKDAEFSLEPLKGVEWGSKMEYSMSSN